jgi:hypothetical protein
MGRQKGGGFNAAGAVGRDAGLLTNWAILACFMGVLQPLGVDYKGSLWGSSLKEKTFHINHDKPILGTIQNLPVLGATLHQKNFEFVNHTLTIYPEWIFS